MKAPSGFPENQNNSKIAISQKPYESSPAPSQKPGPGLIERRKFIQQPEVPPPNPIRRPTGYLNKPNYNPSYPVRNFRPNPDNIPNSATGKQDFEKVLSLISLAFPCIESRNIEELYYKRNCVCDDNLITILESVCTQNIEQNHIHPYQFSGLELQTYKTQPCELKDSCNNEYCRKYHCLAERRRMPVDYTDELCKFRFNCSSGDSCKKCHNLNEVRYHPARVEKCRLVFEPDQNVQVREMTAREKHKQLLGARYTITKELEKNLIALAELKGKVLCGKCSTNRITSVRVPCGHSLCSRCTTGVICPICDRTTTEYLINY